MVPFDVNVGGKRVGISWESLFWFFVVTAGATIVGELIYDKYVEPYLSDIPGFCCGPTAAAIAPGCAARVVSTQGVGIS